MDTNQPINFTEMRKKKLRKKAEEVLGEQVVICYIQGIDQMGEQVFSYVAIAADLLEDFNEAIEEGNVDVDEFGYRIVSGFGEPTDSVRKMMEEDYGFDHERQQIVVNKPDNDD